jgi:hypothetical protein
VAETSCAEDSRETQWQDENQWIWLVCQVEREQSVSVAMDLVVVGHGCIRDLLYFWRPMELGSVDRAQMKEATDMEPGTPWTCREEQA